jgi:hypothetical protein
MVGYGIAMDGLAGKPRRLYTGGDARDPPNSTSGNDFSCRISCEFGFVGNSLRTDVAAGSYSVLGSLARHMSSLVLGEGSAYHPRPAWPHNAVFEDLGAFANQYVDAGVAAYRGCHE